MSNSENAITGDPPAGGFYQSPWFDMSMVRSIVSETMTQVAKRERNDQGNGSAEMGAITRAYREDDGYPISQLASLAGLHPTTIGKVESGQRGMSLHTFTRLAGVLGMNWARDIINLVGEWPDD